MRRQRFPVLVFVRRVVAHAAHAVYAVLLPVACMDGNTPTGPLLGAACAPRGPYMGEFEGTASGALNASMAGCAFYIVESVELGDQGASTKVSLILSNGELGKFQQSIGIYRWGSFFRGTHQVGSPAQGMVYGRVRDSATGKLYDLSSGTVDVYWSSGGGFSAHLSVTATLVGGTDTITITGSIIARCVDPNKPPVNDEGNPDETYIGPCHGGAAG